MRVALADDSALFRAGLAQLLTVAGITVTAQAGSGDELLVLVAADPPDAAIVDMRMPPTWSDEGLVTAERLRAAYPRIGVLVLSTYTEPTYAARLLGDDAAGVGYLLKDRVADVQELLDALQRLTEGQSVVDREVIDRLVARHDQRHGLMRLTERERAVLHEMAEGRSNSGIAQKLTLSARTVENHVANVFTKLGLPPAADDNRRVLAVLAWLRATSGGGWRR